MCEWLLSLCARYRDRFAKSDLSDVFPTIVKVHLVADGSTLYLIAIFFSLVRSRRGQTWADMASANEQIAPHRGSLVQDSGGATYSATHGIGHSSNGLSVPVSTATKILNSKWRKSVALKSPFCAIVVLIRAKPVCVNERTLRGAYGGSSAASAPLENHIAQHSVPPILNSNLRTAQMWYAAVRSISFYEASQRLTKHNKTSFQTWFFEPVPLFDICNSPSLVKWEKGKAFVL